MELTLESYIRATQPLIIYESSEPDLAEQHVTNVSKRLRRVREDLATYDALDAVTKGKPIVKWLDTQLEAARDATDKNETDEPVTVVVVRNVQFFLDEKNPQRQLLIQWMHNNLSDMKDNALVIVGITPGADLPEELERIAVIHDSDLPPKESLLNHALGLAQDYNPDLEKMGHDKISREKCEDVAEIGVGMTVREFKDALTQSLVAQKTFAPEVLMALKRQMIKKSEILELVYPGPLDNFDHHKGAEIAKRFIMKTFGPTARGVILTGVPGCLHADTPIHDPVDESTLTVRERYLLASPFHVTALSADGPVVTRADPPEQFSVEPMLTLTMEDGEEITVTAAHKFWSGSAWITAADVAHEVHISGSILLPSSSEHAQRARKPDAPRSTRTTEGSPHSCSLDHRRCGEQLREGAETAAAPSPSQDGALERTQPSSQKGALGRNEERTRSCQSHARPSTPDCAYPRASESVRQSAATTDKLVAATSRNAQQSPAEAPRQRTCEPLQHHAPASTPAGQDACAHALPPCTSRCTPQADEQTNQPQAESASHALQSNPNAALQRASTTLPQRTAEPLQLDAHLSTQASISSGSRHTGYDDTEYVRVVKVADAPASAYYDFSVPVYENYFACGVWNHNSGKTYLARAIAGELGVPLVIFDLQSIYDMYVGNSEKRLKRALKAIDRFGKCVVLVDEVEKALRSVGGGESRGGGVSDNAMAILLKWLQDRPQTGAYIIATSNDAKSVADKAPEYFRPGRWDATFFMDIPTKAEKVAIWDVWLKHYNLAESFDALEERPEDSDWAGAEIETCCRLADLAGGQPIDMSEFICPTMRTAEENILNLRAWAADRTINASLEVNSAAPGGRRLAIIQDPDDPAPRSGEEISL